MSENDRDAERLHTVMVVLWDLDERAATAEERRRRLPDDNIVRRVLRYAFETEPPVDPAGDDPSWRADVVKWLPDYFGRDRDELLALLTRALGWPPAADSYHAALHLAELAPDTPGLPERLLDAACEYWVASYAAQYDHGETGADRAIEALDRLGATEVLDDLLAALAAGRCFSPRAGTKLFLFWGGDAAELVRRSWDEPADPTGFLFAALEALPLDTPGLVDRIAPLVESRGDGLEAYEALVALARFGCRADILLPAAARGFDRNRHHNAPMRGEDILRAYLAALPAYPERWTDEDRWVMTLMGKPAGALDWAVYADWLDDRDDERGRYVRLLHALAVDPSERSDLSDRLEWWSEIYGGRWEHVYHMISAAAPAGPPAPAG